MTSCDALTNIGNLNIPPSFYQSIGKIYTIWISGRTPKTQYGQISLLNYTANLTGWTLNVILIPPVGSTDNFKPNVGDKFEILVFKGILNEFTAKSLPENVNWKTYKVPSTTPVSGGQKYVLEVIS